ncbi:signal recognition particle receptor subunit beta-like isoform X1 [Gossypium australe]|uniref:Signal recognition particle receptor subunit beta-like isoform X1 n=1 Tax=Gossypium australe TaxID=47621 RepID=A0A5B6UE37_9ROSI|nr:signal recognition particle receptor subunit beta-like isoform X1 [Gossypium australe]
MLNATPLSACALTSQLLEVHRDVNHQTILFSASHGKLLWHQMPPGLQVENFSIERELTNLRHPRGSEIIYKGSLINKILNAFFQCDGSIYAAPSAALKDFPLNFNIGTFLDNIPQPRTTKTPKREQDRTAKCVPDQSDKTGVRDLLSSDKILKQNLLPYGIYFHGCIVNHETVDLPSAFYALSSIRQGFCPFRHI